MVRFPTFCLKHAKLERKTVNIQGGESRGLLASAQELPSESIPSDPSAAAFGKPTRSPSPSAGQISEGSQQVTNICWNHEHDQNGCRLREGTHPYLEESSRGRDGCSPLTHVPEST